MGGIGALLATCLEQFALTEGIEHQVEEPPFCLPFDQPGPELTQDRGIEPRIGEVQGERILPVDPAADRIRCLHIGQVFDVLHDGHQR
jgi:hypothetical protein